MWSNLDRSLQRKEGLEYYGLPCTNNGSYGLPVGLHSMKSQNNCIWSVEIDGFLRFQGTEVALEKMQNSDSASEEQKLRVRKLEISDKGKGFIELLQQLSVCDSVSDKEFEDRYLELSSLGDDHVICVIEDELCGRIIATGSVFIEKKFLRNCGKVGHIEDVVVDSSARGKQLGKKVINFLTDHARSMGCYKVILDCSLENKVFYEKCGFRQKEVQMVMYFI